jgi:hypothetical protein
MPSVSKFIPTTNREMAPAGASAIQGASARNFLLSLTISPQSGEGG